MIDLFDIFDLYQQSKIGSMAAVQADSSRRLTDASERPIVRTALAGC